MPTMAPERTEVTVRGSSTTEPTPAELDFDLTLGELEAEIIAPQATGGGSSCLSKFYCF